MQRISCVYVHPINVLTVSPPREELQGEELADQSDFVLLSAVNPVYCETAVTKQLGELAVDFQVIFCTQDLWGKLHFH